MPWAAGATLVPKPAGASLLGPDLHEYLLTRADHGDVLRAHAAVDDRGGPAGPAVPARLRRGLPARPDRALAQAGQAVPQRLRAHRGHGHRHLDPGRPRPRRDHRRAPAHLLGRRPRPRRPAPRPAPRRDRRAGHRRDRAGPRVRQPRRPHREGVHPGLPAAPGQPVGAHLPHGRPVPDQRAGRDRVPRADRPPGQDPRLSDRAHRDRVGAAAGAGDRRRRRRHLRTGAGHRRAGRLLQPADRHGRRGPGDDLRGAARPAAVVHGPGLPGAPRRHPADDQRQGGPQEPPGAVGAAGVRTRARARRAGRTDRDGPGRAARRRARARQGLHRRAPVRRPGRELPVAGPVLREGPPAPRPGTGVDPRGLRAPDGDGARRAAAGPPGRRHARADGGPCGTARDPGRRVHPRGVRHRAAAPVPRLAGRGGEGAGDRVPVGGGRDRRRRRLPACPRLGCGDLLRIRAAADRRQVVARRALQAVRVPRVGNRLPAVLAGEDADPGQPDDDVHGVAAAPDVPARPRCAHREGRGRAVPARRRVPGPAHGRAGHRGPRGLGGAVLPRRGRADPARPRHAGRERGRLGEDGARHRHRGR